MTNSPDNLQVIFVKYEDENGALNIGRHANATLLSPDQDIDDYVRDIVHEYKANPKVTYLGLADQDEYEAFLKIQG